ncbi:MAG: V-type ATP synthase subunit E family protein [Clostridia bacterium]
MNAEAITNKILEDARAQAAQTLLEAREKAARIQADADAAAAVKKRESQKQADRQAVEVRDRMLRMAELDQKKAMLSVKREVIEQAFLNALERMRKMPDTQKRAYLQKLIVSSAQGGEALIVSGEEAALYDGAFLGALRAALEKAGKANVTLAGETRPLGGGFVLKKGGMEINCAFQAVLGQYRASLEAEVAAVLFK